MKNKNNLQLKHKISAVILAILPILSPYALLNAIPINLFLLALATIFIFLLRGSISKKATLPLTVLWIGHLMLSSISIFLTNYNISLVNSMIVISFNVLCIVILWSNCNFKYFVKVANVIGVICSLFLFIQATYLMVGFEAPSGRLFNLKLLDYAGFVTTTYGFRLNSFFQEPSYFAIYILPLLVINLKEKNMKLILMYALGLVVSSSTLGILGGLIVVIYYLLIEKKEIKYFLLLFLIAIMIHLLMFNYIDYYNISLTRTVDKMFDITEGRSDIRFAGQISLFNELPLMNKIFGVGVNQMQNYFSSVGIFAYNYSNSFVTVLINTGIFGLTMYLIFIVYTAYRAFIHKQAIFFLIFIMVASIDYLIYNYYFFYLLTFIYVEQKGWFKE